MVAALRGSDDKENGEIFLLGKLSASVSPRTNNPVERPSASVAFSATTLMEARLWLMGCLVLGLIIWERRRPDLSTWKMR